LKAPGTRVFSEVETHSEKTGTRKGKELIKRGLGYGRGEWVRAAVPEFMLCKRKLKWWGGKTKGGPPLFERGEPKGKKL